MIKTVLTLMIICFNTSWGAGLGVGYRERLSISVTRDMTDWHVVVTCRVRAWPEGRTDIASGNAGNPCCVGGDYFNWLFTFPLWPGEIICIPISVAVLMITAGGQFKTKLNSLLACCLIGVRATQIRNTWSNLLIRLERGAHLALLIKHSFSIILLKIRKARRGQGGTRGQLKAIIKSITIRAECWHISFRVWKLLSDCFHLRCHLNGPKLCHYLL